MLITKPDSPGFNSYASIDDLKRFASERGFAAPVDDAGCESVLFQAMDYLEGMVWKGVRSTPDQSLSWPRTGVYIEGRPLDKASIPDRVKMAQIRLAIEAQENELNPTRKGGAVTMERVEGAITVEYDGSSNDGSVSFPWLSGLLRGLSRGASPFNFDVRRG